VRQYTPSDICLQNIIHQLIVGAVPDRDKTEGLKAMKRERNTFPQGARSQFTEQEQSRASILKFASAHRVQGNEIRSTILKKSGRGGALGRRKKNSNGITPVSEVTQSSSW